LTAPDPEIDRVSEAACGVSVAESARPIQINPGDI
jgi:hypothetical protein